MADIKTPVLGGEDSPLPILTFLDVAANTQLEGGRIAWSNASGYAVPSSAATTACKAWGIYDENVNNLSTNTPYGAAGAKKATVRTGLFLLRSSDGTGVRAAIGSYAYLVSDTGTGRPDISTSDAGGTRPLVGVIVPNPRGSTSPDDASMVPVWIGGVRADADNPELAASRATAFTARVVATSIGANTGTGTGVLTITATGALGAQDGVTCAAGDVIFIQEGTTNVAAIDAGPWTITTIGTTGVSAVLTRPDWWTHGGTMIPGAVIEIGGEGTGTTPRFAGSQWKSFAAKGTVIDTTAPSFWPRQLSGVYTASSGVVLNAYALFPIRSATTSVPLAVNTGTAAHASTVGPPRVTTLPTAGVTGSASLTMKAESAPGTVNASDVGVYTVSVTNW